jgi:4-hydroxybenzoate polyprenyltransferase
MLFKRFPLVDAFALSGLYSLRLFAGGEVTGNSVSIWLLAFSGFLFFSLALIKRVAELQSSQKNRLENRLAGRGYYSGDTDILLQMGLSSSFASCAVLALYVNANTAFQYANPRLFWFIVPLILFWQCRMWLATSRGQMHDDPIVFASKDWVSWLISGFVLLIMVLSYSGLMQ